MSGKLIDMPIGAARAEKWRAGREKFGPMFVGHPLEELHDELIDAMNYTTAAILRRKLTLLEGTLLGAELLAMCERVRELYRRCEDIE